MVALGLAVSAAASLVAVPSASGASNGVWSISSPPEFGGGSEPINLQVAPGQVGQSYVTLENLTRDPLDVGVVATQGQREGAVAPNRPTADGDAVPSPNTAQWITLAAPNSLLAPRASTRVDVNVAVPPGTPSGDYVAGVLGVTEGAFNPLTQARTQLAQQILIFVRVTGPLTNKLDLSSISVVGTTAQLTVENAGNTRLSPKLTATAVDAAGAALVASPAVIGNLEPGQSQPASFTFSQPPAKVVVTSDSAAPPETQEWPVKPIDALVLQPGDALPDIPNQGDESVEVWVWIVLATLGLILLVWAGSRRRRRKRRFAQAEAAAARRAADLQAAAMPVIPPAVIPATAPPRPPGYQAPPPAPPPQPPTAPGSWVGGEGSRSVVVPRS
jgi:hypothetical protein